MFPRRWPLVPATAVLLAAFFMSSGMSAGAAHSATPVQGSILLQPSDAQGNAIPDSTYYQISARPGSFSVLYALIGNSGRSKERIALAAVDAGSGVYGGISYNLPGSARRHAGAWLALSKARLSVPPGVGRVVSIAVRVPQRVAPGQYIGGVTAYSQAQSTSHSRRRGRSGSLQIQFRRVVAVLITVPGPQHARFTVRRVSAKRRPDATYILAHIKNIGNTLSKCRGTLWVWKIGKRKAIITAHLSLGVTVPHTTVHYPVFWSKRPSSGVYHFRVRVWWAGGASVRDGHARIK
ncbi:MAG: hypothetical protein ACRDFX_03770 [Chloroflexota bacterium]